MSRIKAPVPSQRAILVAWSAVALALVAAVVWLTFEVITSRQTSQASREDRADLRNQIETLQVEASANRETAEVLAEQVEDLGEEPVVEPAPPTGRSAAAVFLQPTLSQVESALRRICDGTCKGESGDDGADSVVPGPPGADSTVPGPPGPAGPAGGTGPAGADAPRITFIECEGMTPFTLTVGLNDGTIYDVQCGYLEPVPEPTVDPVSQ